MTETPKSPRSRSLYLAAVLAVLVLGTTLRFVGIGSIGLSDVGDGIYFTEIAKSWSEGEHIYRIEDQTRYYRPVVFAFFGAAIRLFGFDDTAIKLCTAAVDSLNLALIFLIAHLLRPGRPWVHFAAASTYAVLPVALFMARSEHGHVISGLMVLLSFLAFVLYDGARGAVRYGLLAVSGLFAGLAAMTHDELIFLTPGYLLFVALGTFRRREWPRLLPVIREGLVFLSFSLLACYRLIWVDRRAAAGFAKMEFAEDPGSRVADYFGRLLRFPWNSLVAISSYLFAALLVVLVVVVGVVLLRDWRRGRVAALGLRALDLLPAVLCVTYFVFYAYFFDYYYSRLLLPLFPLVLVAAAIWASLLLERFGAPRWQALVLVAALLLVPLDVAQFAKVARVMGKPYSRTWVASPRGLFDVGRGYRVLVRWLYEPSWIRRVWDEIGSEVGEDARLLVTSELLNPNPGRRPFQIGYYFGDDAIYLVDHDEPLDELIRDRHVRYLLFSTETPRPGLMRQEYFLRYEYGGKWSPVELVLGASYGFARGEFDVDREYEIIRQLATERGAKVLLLNGRRLREGEALPGLQHVDYILFEL